MKTKCGDYEIFDRKTKKCNKCQEGFIKRASYLRGSKKRGNNLTKKSKKTYVHEACIKSRGLPGKTSLRYGKEGGPKGIGPLKKGELGRFGYHHLEKITKRERQNSLKMAVKELGAPTIVRKLGAIRTYLKNTSPKVSKIFYEDQRWVRKTFDDDFKGDYKTSALFNKNV
tara:strand:- start:295 stop:804 length:510 start_codon:yes stop_codon:yes gene_type:complete